MKKFICLTLVLSALIFTTSATHRRPNAHQDVGATYPTQMFFARNVQIVDQRASETAIAINQFDTNLVIAGSNYFETANDFSAMYQSKDGGLTWKYVPLGNGANGDPTVAWSADGKTCFTASLGNCGSPACEIFFFSSTDNGTTWGNEVFIDAQKEDDREIIYVDDYDGSPFKGNVYIIYDSFKTENNEMMFGWSNNGGKNWNIEAFPADSPGLGGDIASNKQGVVYYIWPSFKAKTINFQKSTDGGKSFSNPTVVSHTNGSFAIPVPAMSKRQAAIYVSTAVDNTATSSFQGSVYACWTDCTAPQKGTASSNHVRIVIAYSRNAGSSWTFTAPHSLSDTNTIDRMQPWMAVDQFGNGRVYIAYYDTQNWADRTGVDLMLSWSDNGAAAWARPVRITGGSSYNTAFDPNQYGDYLGLAALKGRIMPIWSDNRVGTNGPVTVWTGLLDDYVINKCGSLNVGYSTDVTTIVANQIVTFTAIVSGGVAPYKYEWNFHQSAHTDCSTSVCTFTFTSKTTTQVALFVTDSASPPCYRGATAFVHPA